MNTNTEAMFKRALHVMQIAEARRAAEIQREEAFQKGSLFTTPFVMPKARR